MNHTTLISDALTQDAKEALVEQLSLRLSLHIERSDIFRLPSVTVKSCCKSALCTCYLGSIQSYSHAELSSHTTKASHSIARFLINDHSFSRNTTIVLPALRHICLRSQPCRWQECYQAPPSMSFPDRIRSRLQTVQAKQPLPSRSSCECPSRHLDAPSPRTA